MGALFFEPFGFFPGGDSGFVAFKNEMHDGVEGADGFGGSGDGGIQFGAVFDARLNGAGLVAEILVVECCLASKYPLERVLLCFYKRLNCNSTGKVILWKCF